MPLPTPPPPPARRCPFRRGLAVLRPPLPRRTAEAVRSPPPRRPRSRARPRPPSTGAGSRVCGARPDRHPLQVRRQHARDRARLQRARPLRLPAGHRRHAAAHGPGHEPRRRAGRRQPTCSRATWCSSTPGASRSRTSASTSATTTSSTRRAADARSRSRRSTPRFWQKRFNGARRLVGVLPGLIPHAHRRSSAAPRPAVAERFAATHRSRGRAARPEPARAAGKPRSSRPSSSARPARRRRSASCRSLPRFAQSSALAPLSLRWLTSAPRAISSSSRRQPPLAHRHHQRRRAVGRRGVDVRPSREQVADDRRRGRPSPRRSARVQPGWLTSAPRARSFFTRSSRPPSAATISAVSPNALRALTVAPSPPSRTSTVAAFPPRAATTSAGSPLRSTRVGVHARARAAPSLRRRGRWPRR